MLMAWLQRIKPEKTALTTNLNSTNYDSALVLVDGDCVRYVYRKDVRLPIQLQRAMAAEAEATREARAKVSRERRLATTFINMSTNHH